MTPELLTFKLELAEALDNRMTVASTMGNIEIRNFLLPSLNGTLQEKRLGLSSLRGTLSSRTLSEHKLQPRRSLQIEECLSFHHALAR